MVKVKLLVCVQNVIRLKIFDAFALELLNLVQWMPLLMFRLHGQVQTAILGTNILRQVSFDRFG